MRERESDGRAEDRRGGEGRRKGEKRKGRERESNRGEGNGEGKKESEVGMKRDGWSRDMGSRTEGSGER